MISFAPYGDIESLRMLPDKECAFVNYIRAEDAVAARNQMQGGRLGNCIIRVGFGKVRDRLECSSCFV
jgi:protein JSN1